MANLTELRDALKRRFAHDLNSLERGMLHHEAIQDIQGDVFLALGVDAGAHEDLAREVLYEVIGFGPLLPLMTDPTISEIMVNGPTRVFVERLGQRDAVPHHFESPRHLRYVIQRLLHLSPGKRLDESSPMVDLSLPDGTRVNIVTPPAAVGGPQMTIRKWSNHFADLGTLIEVGTVDERMATFLAAAVAGRQTILVSGAAGTGKTTLVQALSGRFPVTDRVVVIEDTYELHFAQDNQVRLLSKPANTDGAGAILIRDLFHNSLRMSPDRIILGEMRGGEAFDFLQAVTSGHRGSLGILHASSPTEALYRLENLAAQSGLPVPMSVLRQQVAHGLDLVVQIDRHDDGVRRVTAISEVGRVDERGEIEVRDLFRFVPAGRSDDGVRGRFLPTGVVPQMLEALQLAGTGLERGLFTPPE